MSVHGLGLSWRVRAESDIVLVLLFVLVLLIVVVPVYFCFLQRDRGQTGVPETTVFTTSVADFVSPCTLDNYNTGVTAEPTISVAR